MKALPMYLVFLFLFFVTNVYAQPRDQALYEITRGEVTITPAFCISLQCEAIRAKLSGTFSAFIPGAGDQIFFPVSKLTTDPDVRFQLPEDPNLDENGTIRDVEFSLSADGLKVAGTVDSRAFDGPLVEYSFVAQRVTQIDGAFFTARPDFRRCISPLCGGYFVKKVNKRRTECADGTLQKECYVAELDFGTPLVSGALGLGNQTPFLLFGKIRPRVFENFGNLGKFVAKSAYRSATTTTAKGRFMGLEDLGFVCVTAPCFNIEGEVLNRNRAVAFSSIDLNSVGASAQQIDEANKILSNSRTLFASGRVTTEDGLPGGTGRTFVATQFYLPISVPCAEGYSFFDGSCRTPFGCAFPLIELTAVGGAAFIDPITGEVTANITKSCIESCDPPALPDGPGQCSVFLP